MTHALGFTQGFVSASEVQPGHLPNGSLFCLIRHWLKINQQMVNFQPSEHDAIAESRATPEQSLSPLVHNPMRCQSQRCGN